MNKTEFLKELENKIRVLEKNEIKDILAEYSQHIDMRMENGLSEDDAIKDFGDMDDLAAEILEAYHVNPEYERESAFGIPQEEPVKDEKKKSAAVLSIFSACGRGIKKISHGLAGAAKWLWKHFVGIFTALWALIKKPFSKTKTGSEAAVKADSEVLTVREEKTAKKNAKKAARAKRNDKAKGRCRRVIKGFLFLCLCVIAILCMIPVAFVGIVSIFCTGASAVLLFTGYPVMGILIICIGLSVAAVAVFLLLLSLMTGRNKTPKYEAVYTEVTDEAEYIAESNDSAENVENNENNENGEVEKI